ncbi:MAG TPA: glycosyltransferase [Rhizomicrobium sp.]|jgi:cellulose synthase/poly-beta-1,6-N-acetylglucosamine synthase-like glycosyltransferase/peptidoglycan/xylan/chitin deacetylase (PgdA/CDA1 family)
MSPKPIFLDATGRRAARVSFIGWSAAIVSTVLGVAFIASLFFVPNIGSVRLKGEIIAHAQDLVNKSVSPGLLPSAARLAEAAREQKHQLAREKRLRKRRNNKADALARTLQRHPGRPLSIAFFPNWEADAKDSLKVALPQLDWVMPTWLTLHGPNLEFKDSFDARAKEVYDLIRSSKKNVAILPVIQNATLGQWDGAGMAKLLSDPARRKALEQEIAGFLTQHKLQGIVVDFETMPDTDEVHGAMAAFLTELRTSFRKNGWVVAVASPFADDAWPFQQFARLSDYTILMAYDQHGVKGGAGSIAGQTWYEDLLDKRMKVLDPAHTIVAVANYAYDWNGDDVDSMSFEEAVIAANDSDAKVTFDDASNNPHFSYVEDDGTSHDVWLLDAVTAYNEIHAADPYQPVGYALWRLGSEDPSIWSVMGKPYNSPAPDALMQIPTIEEIDYEGQGEILRVEAHPQSGARTFERDAHYGDIDDETYTKLPTGYVIRQFGAAKKTIALTFDDGPDAEWTPQILDILKQKKVPGTFFIIGGNAEANPGLVQREVAEGHEVGNHTYTHPNLSDTPPEATSLELNATQRLFQALTGRSLRLFRPPYLGDAEPTDADEIEPVQTAQDMGYITVGEHVDPVDWELPGVAKIVQSTLDQVHSARGDMPRNIILFHDAGGDRSQTVEALPIVIDKLKAEGYRFVRVSELAGLTPDQAMPPLPATVALLTDRVVFLAMSEIGFLLHWCFWIAIWLGIARLLFLVSFALWNKGRERGQAAVPDAKAPFQVSVLIPAFNEENVIASTVRGILASTYSDLDVVVIDDGSKDRTLEVLNANFANDPRVTVVSIPNGGKANALNIGLAKARGDVVVALDADTQFNRDAIARLVRWFTDPEIGAVAGNAKVGNRINMITRWQALEYIVAQNLERRALAALGTMTVVPGAIGAWRKSSVEAIGGFPSETLAEDQDLTIGLQRAGHKVMFDSSAIAWTEAPSTFRGLAKQRFRWSYGTLQCLWKYRGMMFRPRYGALGMIALPQVWLFQILLTALAPFADLLLIWQLAWEGVAYLEHGAEFSTGNLQVVGLYYGIFVVVDLLAAFAGFLMERREKWSLLWWLVLQRFGYRQLMYYVVVRSLATAIRGPFVGWGKLERTATVDSKLAQEHR